MRLAMTGVPAAIASTATMPKSSIGRDTEDACTLHQGVDQCVARLHDELHRDPDVRRPLPELGFQRTVAGDDHREAQQGARLHHDIESFVRDEAGDPRQKSTGRESSTIWSSSVSCARQSPLRSR